jgi:hypothetical protein
LEKTCFVKAVSLVAAGGGVCTFAIKATGGGGFMERDKPF